MEEIQQNQIKVPGHLSSVDAAYSLPTKAHKITAEDYLAAVRVDHDHETGTVRGLLCRRCNWALGIVDDNFELLIRMAGYWL